MTANDRLGLITFAIRHWAEDYILTLESQGASPSTVRSYAGSLRLFAAWCETEGRHDLRDLDSRLLRNYTRALRLGEHLPDARPLAPASVRLYLTAIKSWANWLVGEEILTQTPFERVKAPKQDKTQPTPLSLEEVQAMIEACKRDRTWRGARDAAIILVLLDTGLRASELTSLTVEAVLERTGIQVMGKGRKQRTVYIRRNARKAILRYLALRRDQEPWLWMGHLGRLKPEAINKLLHRRSQEAGVRAVHTHLLRHTFAVEAIKSGRTS